jgi:hypothetical protein
MEFSLKFSVNEDLIAPIGKLYDDLCCLKPSISVNLEGWLIDECLFQKLSESTSLHSLCLNDSRGYGEQDFCLLRSVKSLRKISMAKMQFKLTIDTFETIGNFTFLTTLILPKCDLSPGCLSPLINCKSLRHIDLSYCSSLDNPSLSVLSTVIAKHRKLSIISLSGSRGFTDEALLDLCQSGSSIIAELSIDRCDQLTSLGLVQFQNKMSALRKLNIGSLSVTTSPYFWIGIGCRNLINLSISSSNNLTDEALIDIGRNCPYLSELSIPNCLGISDIGVDGFFKQFLGKLVFLDISGCYKCGDVSFSAISSRCNAIRDLRVNSLSSASALVLKQLMKSCTDLEHFEMCCDLKTTSGMRKSTVPHLSDRALVVCTSQALKIFRVSGAIQVTDVGILALVAVSQNLIELNLSYCSAITDTSLAGISCRLSNLKILLLNACVHITDVGLQSIGAGSCRYSLRKIELNGCNKISDLGSQYLSNLVNLEHLSLRSCDLVSNEGISMIANACRGLKFLDITNLDCIALDVIGFIIRKCRFLRLINCEGCAFDCYEFNSLFKKKSLPFAKPIKGKCSLEAYDSPIIRYNSRILELRQLSRSALILQRFFKKLKLSHDLLRLKLLKNKDLDTLRMYFSNLVAVVASLKKKSFRRKRRKAATKIQKYFLRWYSMKSAQKLLATKRRHFVSAVSVQRVYRGYRARKRLRRRILRRFYADRQIVLFAVSYSLRYHHNLLIEKLVLIQSLARMIPARVKYTTFLYAVQKLQRRFLLTYSMKKNSKIEALRQHELLVLHNFRRNKAAKVIQKNWKIRQFNRQISPFTLYCALIYSYEQDEREWSAKVIQRYWRGFHCRKSLHNLQSRTALLSQMSLRVRLFFKMILQRKRFLSLQPSLRKSRMRRCILFIYSRPRLRLGIHVKIIQKACRHFLFRLARKNGAQRIQLAFKSYKARIVRQLRLLELHTKCGLVIKRSYNRYKARKYREFLRARQHMAAFKIYVRFLRETFDRCKL